MAENEKSPLSNEHSELEIVIKIKTSLEENQQMPIGAMIAHSFIESLRPTKNVPKVEIVNIVSQEEIKHEFTLYKEKVSKLIDFFERQLTGNEHGIQMTENALKGTQLEAINLVSHLNTIETCSFHKGQKKANETALWKLKDLGLR